MTVLYPDGQGVGTAVAGQSLRTCLARKVSAGGPDPSLGRQADIPESLCSDVMPSRGPEQCPLPGVQRENQSHRHSLQGYSMCMARLVRYGDRERAAVSVDRENPYAYTENS